MLMRAIVALHPKQAFRGAEDGIGGLGCGFVQCISSFAVGKVY